MMLLGIPSVGLPEYRFSTPTLCRKITPLFPPNREIDLIGELVISQRLI